MIPDAGALSGAPVTCRLTKSAPARPLSMAVIPDTGVMLTVHELTYLVGLLSVDIGSWLNSGIILQPVELASPRYQCIARGLVSLRV